MDTDRDGLADGLELGLHEADFTTNPRIPSFQKRRLILSDGTKWPAPLPGEDPDFIGIKKTEPVQGKQLWDSDPATKTDPANPDTDNDGFWDGPDVLIKLPSGATVLHIGEDKNGNGKYEPLGEDGLPGTEDDETDPRSPASFPLGAASHPDSDGDGIPDSIEDEIGTSSLNPDSDGDGVLDGDELYVYMTSPTQPDSDNDGLPDGYELGLTRGDPALQDATPGKNEYNARWYANLDRTRAYLYRLKNEDRAYAQYAFLPPWHIGRSDPLCYDTDFDHINDVVEENSGSDPERGFVRLPDEPPPNLNLTGRLEPGMTWRGLAPIYRSPDDEYLVFVNWATDGAGGIIWTADLPVSLGRTPGNSIIVSAEPEGTVEFSINNGAWTADSATVSSGDLEPGLRANAARVRLRTVSDSIPELIKLDLNELDPDGQPVIRSYGVTRNQTSYDQAGEVAGQTGGDGGSFAGLSPNTNSNAPPYSVAVGYNESEGELISTQIWTNDDWVTVGTELITSGGEFTLGLEQIATKFVLQAFFTAAVAPIEFWLKFVFQWRDETALRAPEDFRPLTALMLDKNLDVAWAAKICENITEREGWRSIAEQDWLFEADNVPLEDYASRIPSAPIFRPPGEGAGAGTGPGAVGPNVDLGPATARILGRSTELLERLTNHRIASGQLVNYGIKGGKVVDLKYTAPLDGTRRRYGIDGGIMHDENEYTLIETKNVERGKLGVITAQDHVGPPLQVYQTSPGWAKHSMLMQARENPEQFARALEKAEGTDLESVMKFAQYVGNNAEEIARQSLIEEGLQFEQLTGKAINARKAVIEKFARPDLTERILRSAGEAVESARVRRFFIEKFNVVMVTGRGWRLRYSNLAERQLIETIRAFGGTVPRGAELARRFRCVPIKDFVRRIR